MPEDGDFGYLPELALNSFAFTIPRLLNDEDLVNSLNEHTSVFRWPLFSMIDVPIAGFEIKRQVPTLKLP